MDFSDAQRVAARHIRAAFGRGLVKARVERIREKHMANRKNTTQKKQARKGAKSTTRRTAGKTARAAETFKVPRTAKQLAEGINQRLKRSPGYWGELQSAMSGAGTSRVAQVMPRENGSAGATH